MSREKTAARIRGAASSLFNQYGYCNVTMEDIAKKAQCSAGLTYTYFKSKAHLAGHLLGFDEVLTEGALFRKVVKDQYQDFFGGQEP